MIPPEFEESSLPETVDVLYVDDDPDFGELVSAFLARSRDALSVATATSGEEALRRLGDDSVDCVVSDYDMPGMDGLELLEAVRANCPDLPFILFTGRGNESVASRAISAGVTDYLQKRSGTEQFDRLANRVVDAVSNRWAHATLTNVETRYRRLVERAPAPIVIIDADGDVAYANDATAETLGAASAGEVVGREAVSFVHPDDRERSTRHLRRVLGSGDTLSTRRIRLLGFDGETKYVDLSNAAVTYRGRPAAQVVLNDVTEQRRSEEKLRSTGSVLSTLVENIPAGILVEDSSRDVLFANRRLTEMFAVPATPDRLVGQDCAEAAERVADRFADVDRFLDGNARSAVERETIEREELELVDGRTFERSGTPVRIDEDRVGYLWMYHDITERKRRERELQEERAFVESALDTLPDAFYAFDTDGSMLRWNDRLTEISGYSDAEIASMNPLDFVESGDRSALRDACEEVLETGFTSVEAAFLTKDGARRPYEFNGSRITDDEGEVFGIAGTGRDIAARKRYEETLTALHNATRRVMTAETKSDIADIATRCACDVLDLPLNGVLLYDSATEALEQASISPEARDLLGGPVTIRRGEGIAWEVFETGEPQVHDDVREAGGVVNTDTDIRGEILLPLGDHGVFLAGSPEVGAFDESDVSLAKILASNLESALDRADREQTLRLREATLTRQNERLDQFASIVSHDLRNPLNVAQGRVELAMETGDGDHLPKARRALDRIEELVGGVLTLAREGRVVSDPSPVSLERTAADAAEIAGLDADQLALAGDGLGRVVADGERLDTLFENLFRNAREHGGDRVRVGVLREGDGFYVEDDGPGIPEEKRDGVFDHGYTTRDGGTGFGLGIVESIAEAHGWTVTVGEGSDGGARFEVRGVQFETPARSASN